MCHMKSEELNTRKIISIYSAPEFNVTSRACVCACVRACVCVCVCGRRTRNFAMVLHRICSQTGKSFTISLGEHFFN